MRARLGRSVSRYRDWVYLTQLKPTTRHGLPRLRQALADPDEQETFKKAKATPGEVATAFPEATVECWAVDEHRIGLKPLLRRAWTPGGVPRPHVMVQHRFAGRWLVGFVHPASGRTVCHRASAVSI